MKITLSLFLAMVLVACMVSCQKPEPTAENAPVANAPAPPPAPVAAPAPAPAPAPSAAAEPAPVVADEPEEPAPPKKPAAPKKPTPKRPAPTEEPAEPEEPAAPVAEPPKKNAGLGVIFVTDIKEGIFRVKVDNEKVYETNFQKGSSGKDEIRVEKELRLAPGKRQLKFVAVDKSTGKVVDRQHTMIFEPKSHHAVKLILTGENKVMELQERE